MIYGMPIIIPMPIHSGGGHLDGAAMAWFGLCLIGLVVTTAIDCYRDEHVPILMIGFAALNMLAFGIVCVWKGLS